jgi:hypothetical protein
LVVFKHSMSLDPPTPGESGRERSTDTPADVGPGGGSSTAGRVGGTGAGLVRAALLAVIVALAAAVVVLPGGRVAVVHFPLDDSWIHQVYARSLAERGELAYNPGDPQPGFTSPLWLLVSTPLHWLFGADAEAVAVGAKLLSLLFLWAAALASGRLAVRLSGSRRAGFWAGALVVALSPSLLFAGLAAMAVTLAAWLLLELVRAAIDGRPVALALAAAGAVWARPESLVAVGVVALWALFWAGGPGRRRWTLALATASPAAAAFGAWALWCWSTNGFPLPNTYYAKTTHPDLKVGLTYWASDVLAVEYWVRSAIGPVLLLAGVLRIRPWRHSGLVLGAALTTSLAIAASHDLVLGVGFYMQRYFYPLLPLFLVVAAAGGVLAGRRWLATPAAGAPAPRVRPGLARLLAVVAGLALLATWALDLRERSETYGSNCDLIRRLHVEPAKEIAARAPDDWIVAAEAAGATRYFSGHYTVDLLGLNTWEIAHLSSDPTARRCFFAALDPRLFVVPAGWVEALEPTFELRPLSAIHTEVDTIWREPRARTVVTLLARRRPDALRGCSSEPASD